MDDFNVITSPTQEGALATGNEQPPSPEMPPSEPAPSDAFRMFTRMPQPAPSFSAAATKSDQGPVSRIMAAVMRSSAAVQGQAQAKRVAGEQQDQPTPVVTIKAGPHGPLVTVKDAPVDLLNHSQDDDVTKAYQQPREQVERALAPKAPTSQPDTTHPLEIAARAVDTNLGYSVPRPWAPDIAENLKSEKGIATLAQQDGIPNAERYAHDLWRRMRKGELTAAAVAQNVANHRAARIENLYRPIQQITSEQQQAAIRDKEASIRDQQEKDRQTSEARLRQALTDREQKAVLSRKQDIIAKTDFSQIPREQWHQTFDDQNDTGVAATKFEYAKIERKAAQDVRDFYNDFFIKKSETYQLGHFPSFDAAKQAYGHDFASKEEEARARNAWSSAHAYTQRQVADDAAKQENRQLRSELMLQRLAAATVEKPMALTPADVHYMATDELLNTPPEKIKNYDQMLLRKESQINKDLEEPTKRRYKAGKDRVALMQEANEASANGTQVRDYRVRLASYEADQKIANDEIAKLTAERQAVQAARAARRGGTATPATKTAAPQRLQKTQVNPTTKATRIVYSDDGGATWHP